MRSKQLVLDLPRNDGPESTLDVPADLPAAFRRLYYHLYSNSNVSRAERLIEDLSLVLLLKLAVDTSGIQTIVESYINGRASANLALLPVLTQHYPDLIKAGEQFSLDDASLKLVLTDLESIDLSKFPAHTLGDAFQALIGPRLRGEKGQFFTPRSLVYAMVNVVAPLAHEVILDPACGTGGFLSEAHAYQRRTTEAKHGAGVVVGIDKDDGLSRFASALMHVVTNRGARIGAFNSLDPREWDRHFGDRVPTQYDVILTNPPFGSRIGITDPEILKQYALANVWNEPLSETLKWTRTSDLRSSQDPQVLFIELCVSRLKQGGRLGIVLPEGLFGNRNSGYIWDWLRERGHIFALIDCPRTTFQPGTDTKTNVLFFQKHRSSRRPRLRGSTQIAVALKCGHDRRGRSLNADGSPYADDFKVLADCYNSDSPDSLWSGITDLRPYYLVPRYYTSPKEIAHSELELTRGAQMLSLGTLLDEGAIDVFKGHEVGAESYGSGRVPFVRTSDISNFEISADPTKSVSEELYRRFSSQQRLASGDILIVVDGRYRIGSTAILTESNVKCIVQSHFRIIRVKDHAIDPYALLFALNLESVRLRLRNLVFVQSTLGTVGKRLFELQVPVLTGTGPWEFAVTKFRRALQERDRLLGSLRKMETTEIEL